MNCGLDTSANELMESLTQDVDIKIPEIDLNDDKFQFPGDTSGELYKEVTSVTNKDITQHTADGMGTFDALMAGVDAYLDKQYKLNRITGDDYASAYVALSEVAMSNAVQFVLQKDTTKWAAINAQLGALTARVNLETEKTKLATIHIDAFEAKTRYALSKSQLAISGVEHCAAQFRFENILPKESLELQRRIEGLDAENRIKLFNLTTMLPTEHRGLERDVDIKEFTLKNTLPIDYRTKLYSLTEMMPTEKDMLLAQIEGVGIDNETKTFNLDEILPKQRDMLSSQIAGIDLDNDTKTYNLETMLPSQHDLLLAQIDGVTQDNLIKVFTLEEMLPAQLVLTQEQTEVQRAQTLDTRSDGAPVVGTLGKQKDLYTQQIESYKRSSEINAAKMWVDTWITQKSLDEDLLPPTILQNSSVDAVLTAIRDKNELV